MIDYQHGPGLRARLAQGLSGHVRTAVAEAGLKHASVAIVVAAGETDGAASFILTRRAPRLNRHAGQWALPGGRLDVGETPVEAALRELEEEIALKLGPDDVLGHLDDYPTRSGYCITPIVVWAGPDATMTANPAEVASIHPIRLAELDRPDSPQFIEIAESDRPVIRLPIGDSLVHAPTAAVLFQFREVAMHGRPTRVAHLEQPTFAWR